MAVTAGLAVLGWLLMLAFSSSASAAEQDADAGAGGGLLGGVVGGLTDTTSNLTKATLDTVKATTETVTKTVQNTVKTVTDTVKTVTDTVDDTLDAVTRPVRDTVEQVVRPVEQTLPAVQPVETAPAAPAQPVRSEQQAAKPSAKTVHKDGQGKRDLRAPAKPPAADRPEKPAPTPVSDLTHAPASHHSKSADGHHGGSGSGGSQLPSAPCGVSSAGVVAADSAGKKLVAIVADDAAISHLQRAGTGSSQPSAATVAAAVLPCTSPD